MLCRYIEFTVISVASISSKNPHYSGVGYSVSVEGSPHPYVISQQTRLHGLGKRHKLETKEHAMCAIPAKERVYRLPDVGTFAPGHRNTLGGPKKAGMYF